MSTAKDFYNTIKDHPNRIIAWAKREIREYEKLIKLLENDKGTNKRTR